MKINLNRDSSNGAIKSGMNPINLRGGHYYIFKEGDNPPRCLVKAVTPEPVTPFEVKYNATEPCQPTSQIFDVKEKAWAPEPWGMLFNHMNSFKCNFLRVWLTGGTPVKFDGTDLKPLDSTPFVSAKVGGKWKWKVYDAVVNGVWNEEYFRKLKAFAEIAENAGVVLQISLFNYVDLATHNDDDNFRGWCKSPWNPSLSLHPTDRPGWAINHLVQKGNSFACDDAHETPEIEKARQTYFLAPENNLRIVQQALVKKTVETLRERTNIIYEIMNEPRNATNRQFAEFNSKVIGWILAAANVDTPGANKRPLISVNATNFPPASSTDPKIFDVDWWRDNQTLVEHYDKIDAISYHGLTGFNATKQKVCGKVGQLTPPVNKISIDVRFNAHRSNTHRSRHNTKSLIYCTDSARIGVLEHKYKERPTSVPNRFFNVRDGQIFTQYPNDNSDTPQNQRKKSDLQNWSYWCFRKAVPNPGMVHFQNHSLNQITYRRINAAYNQALAAPPEVSTSEVELPAEMPEQELVG